MATAAPNVLPIFDAPCREESLKAISICLLRIRSGKGLTCAQLGELLKCSAETVANATNEVSLLGFESIARLGYFFPDEFRVVGQLWDRRAVEPPTVPERIERITDELEAIKREVATT